MIQQFIDLFKKSEDKQYRVLLNSDVQRFELVYGDLIIGYLEVYNAKWKFYYSDIFKRSQDFNYISGFSDLNKIYESDSLWPFFKIRIPGLSQPRIKKTLEKEAISSDDELALLKRFGKKSISNPYLLIPIS